MSISIKDLKKGDRVLFRVGYWSEAYHDCVISEIAPSRLFIKLEEKWYQCGNIDIVELLPKLVDETLT